jgi:hypothetical protein
MARHMGAGLVHAGGYNSAMGLGQLSARTGQLWLFTGRSKSSPNHGKSRSVEATSLSNSLAVSIF